MGFVSEQADLYERAAECQRLMDAASDSDRQETLKQLRDMWITLANTEYLAKKIAYIEKLQLGLSS